MRTLDLDWVPALEQLVGWQRLSFEAQTVLLSAQPADPVSGRIDDLVLEELVRTGWCERDPESDIEGGLRRARDRRPILRALRAMVRAPVLHPEPDSNIRRPRTDGRFRALDDYLVEHGDREDLERIGGLQAEGRAHVTSRLANANWVLAFLHRDEPGVLSAERRARYGKVSSDVLEVADKVILVLVEHGEPWSLTDAYETFVSSDTDDLRAGQARRFADALRFVLREGLVLICLDDGLRPFLGLWPPVLENVKRRLLAQNQAVETTPEPAQKWSRPQLVDDLLVLLSECAGEPPRIKANRRELFAKSSRQLAERLLPIPRWLADAGLQITDDMRLERAVGAGLQFGFVESAGKAGRDLRLVVTSKGREWLAQTPADRLRGLIDGYRNPEAREGAEERFRDFDPAEEDLESMRAHASLLPYRPYHYYLWNVDFEIPTIDAFRKVPQSDDEALFVDLQSHLARHAALNPIVEQLSPERLSWLGSAEVERMWLMVLSVFFVERIMALGGAELGVVSGRIVFRLTNPARYLLELSDDLYLDALPADTSVIVQPNFEVVFLTPSPEIAHELSLLAEPLEAHDRGEQVGTLFQLTKGSIYRVASTGLSADGVIEALSRLLSEPLPTNVEQQVRMWCEQIHWVRPRRLSVLETDDEQAAVLVVEALGKAARLLSPTVVEISNDLLTEAQRRRLRDRGIYLRESAHEQRSGTN